MSEKVGKSWKHWKLKLILWPCSKTLPYHFTSALDTKYQTRITYKLSIWKFISCRNIDGNVVWLAPWTDCTLHAFTRMWMYASVLDVHLECFCVCMSIACACMSVYVSIFYIVLYCACVHVCNYTWCMIMYILIFLCTCA